MLLSSPVVASCLSLFRFLSHLLFHFFVPSSSLPPSFIRPVHGRAVAQPISLRALTAKIRFRSQASPYGICGQSGSVIGFSPCTRFTAAIFISPLLRTHSITYHRRCNLSNLKHLSVTRFKTRFPSSIKRTVGRQFAIPVINIIVISLLIFLLSLHKGCSLYNHS